MRVGFIENMMPFAARRAAYEADITYGTNSEFGFDYLRDNMAVALDGVVQRGHTVRDRGRGRLDPHRRGADAADHLGRAGDGRADLLRLRAHREDARGHPAARAPRRASTRPSSRAPTTLYDEKHKTVSPGRAGDRQGRARARDRQPLRPAQRPARQPPHPGAEGPVALPARRRLRRPGRRGQDRRRVHRPDHGGPPLVGGPAPGGRGEGGRADPGGARHARDDHAPELLPPLREARRHDRHGEDRGEGVRRDLRPGRRRDPDQRAVARDDENDLIFKTKEAKFDAVDRGHRGAPREGPAGARRHDRRRDLRVPLELLKRRRASRTTS